MCVINAYWWSNKKHCPKKSTFPSKTAEKLISKNHQKTLFFKCNSLD